MLDIFLNPNTWYTIGIGYAMFSLTTGITSYFTVFKPIFKLVAEMGHTEIFEVTNPKTAVIVTITVSSILAPLMFISTVRGPNADFVKTYINELTKRED